jgi:hypothetical protein
VFLNTTNTNALTERRAVTRLSESGRGGSPSRQVREPWHGHGRLRKACMVHSARARKAAQPGHLRLPQGHQHEALACLVPLVRNACPHHPQAGVGREPLVPQQLCPHWSTPCPCTLDCTRPVHQHSCMQAYTSTKAANSAATPPRQRRPPRAPARCAMERMSLEPLESNVSGAGHAQWWNGIPHPAAAHTESHDVSEVVIASAAVCCVALPRNREPKAPRQGPRPGG